ncbi:MAG: universal stress protein [Nitrospiria bacterium]
MEKINKILTPTDFSLCAASALSYAGFLAGQLKATILLVHVMAGRENPLPPDGELKRKIGRTLERMADFWQRRGLYLETHILSGDPASEIEKAAQNMECGLIVMGIRSGRSLGHLASGSVSERVVRSSNVPVLTVRAREEREGVQPLGIWRGDIGSKGRWGEIILN